MLTLEGRKPEMLKIRKGDENLKLQNCSAGFLFLLRLQFDFVFARGW